MLSLPPLPSGVRILKDAEAARLLASYGNLMPSMADCVTCRGTKVFKWWSYADPSITKKAAFTGEFECPCRDQWMLNRFLLHANIMPWYQQLSWHDATGVEPDAIDVVADYTANCDAYVRGGLGLILHGVTNGTGKTLLVTLLAKGLLAAGVDCYFVTFEDMINRLAAGWKDIDAQQWFQSRIMNAAVLVIDDIGKEYQGKKQGGLPESSFDAVMRHRVASALPTLLTTNLDLEALTRDYNVSVMSLLSERSRVYEMRGKSFRDRSNTRLIQEMDQGLVRPRVLA